MAGTRMKRGVLYKVPGTTNTIEMILTGYLVRDQDGNEIGRRSTRKAALDLGARKTNPTRSEVERCERILGGVLPPLRRVNPSDYGIPKDEIYSVGYYTIWQRVGGYWVVERSFRGRHILDAYWGDIEKSWSTSRPFAVFPQGEDPNMHKNPIESGDIKLNKFPPFKLSFDETQDLMDSDISNAVYEIAQSEQAWNALTGVYAVTKKEGRIKSMMPKSKRNPASVSVHTPGPRTSGNSDADQICAAIRDGVNKFRGDDFFVCKVDTKFGGGTIFAKYANVPADSTNLQILNAKRSLMITIRDFTVEGAIKTINGRLKMEVLTQHGLRSRGKTGTPEQVVRHVVREFEKVASRENPYGSFAHGGSPPKGQRTEERSDERKWEEEERRRAEEHGQLRPNPITRNPSEIHFDNSMPEASKSETIKFLENDLGFNEKDAKSAALMMELSEGGKPVDGGPNWQMSDSDILQWMDKHADDRNGLHGVEAIFEGDSGELSTNYGDLLAEYINTGDTYSATVLYDHTENKFFLTTYGDWVEKWERERDAAELESPTVYLDNQDREDGEVMAMLKGPNAKRVADGTQSIMGSNWECPDGDDFCYAIIQDYVGLVADLESGSDGPEWSVDEGEYYEPE